MILPGARGTTITVVRRIKSGTDSLGNDVWTEERTDVLGLFNPGTSAELVQGQDVITTQPSVYLPTGTDVTAIDRVEIAGLSYEVDGLPVSWVSPFSSWAPGVEVKLRRVTG